jgi:stearoyl-CoA desaturase (delta-9 desaturase)
MIAVFTLFTLHWLLSAFSQSFFLHRYSAHHMFSMSPFWERFFFLFTFITQGSSFLNPRGYAILHRLHHNHSDTDRDPHSPHFSTNIFSMMYKTAMIYDGYSRRLVEAPRETTHTAFPEWPLIERLSVSWTVRIGFGAIYTLFYIAFVPAGMWYLYLLLPFHWLMGPVHGAIVNWAGHKYGYINHRRTKDQSRNTLPVDFLIVGELYQNNHHAHPDSPNFAYRRFEFDPTFQVMRLFAALGIIRFLRNAKTSRGKKQLVRQDERVAA